MKLIALHKVVISASIGVGLLFAVWASWMWIHPRRGTPTHLVLAVLAAVVSAGLVVYLRYFIARTRQLPGGDRGLD